MNNHRCVFSLLVWLLTISLAPALYGQGEKTSSGEEFFIVASADLGKSQLLLKRPTEVTTLLNVDNKTKYLDATGKPIQASDLNTGDTVWVVASGKGQNATAIRIRKGPMTLAELHRLFLDYPEIK